jgi:hypothetical protein
LARQAGFLPLFFVVVVVVVVAVVVVPVGFFWLLAGAATASEAVNPRTNKATSASLIFISVSFAARDPAH